MFMINNKRRRINITVDDTMYKRLQHIRSAYGFKNVCEFNNALLNILCQYIDIAEKRGADRPTQTDSETIIEMFNDLGNYEHTPEGIVPVRHKATDIDE